MVKRDPLAEKYVGRSPYEYCFNNPINLIDPTGMGPDGWIESTTKEGNKMLTYDAKINTKEQAIAEGYKNVQSVYESLHYDNYNSNESYTLNKDGSVYNNNTESTIDVGFNPIRTGDGIFISENNGFKSLSMALQTGGDAATFTGLGLAITGVGTPVGAGFAFVEEWANFAGTTMESGYLFSQKRKKEAVTKMLISLFFMGTGRLGTWKAEQIAGKEAVEKGLNTSAETVVSETNTIMEKTVGKDTEDKITKK